MSPYEIILKKRNGGNLSELEIDFMVRGFNECAIPPYQFSSFLMAVFFRGMSEDEIFSLTKSMMNSGEVLSLSEISKYTVDKHSTGGVGDKVSIILAPLAAAGGVTVPMMCGRSLGHTGGTLDKLESIRGFRTNLSKKDFFRNLKKSKVAMMGQTEKIAPADKKIYALRDITATVDSIPLIAASIMSKKLAEGAKALLLDVKTGNGAFIKDIGDSEKLARLMVKIAKKMKRKCTAVITDMNQPLGYAIGNSLEIKECIETLHDRGPEDLKSLCVEFAAHMFLLGKKTKSIQAGKILALRLIKDGSAFRKLCEMAKNQGGDVKSLENPSLLPSAKYICRLKSAGKGYIKGINTHEIGLTAVMIGAGRKDLSSKIDPGAGIMLHKKIGDFTEKGEPLATIYTSRKNLTGYAKERLLDSFSISKTVPAKQKLIHRIIR
ncbi:MAG: thymidine phosphorylase [Candidatus Aureabacteria bacterium]|nr:thymidine phosphorylase [Candidatus Auribacterota bacterium]